MTPSEYADQAAPKQNDSGKQAEPLDIATSLDDIVLAAGYNLGNSGDEADALFTEEARSDNGVDDSQRGGPWAINVHAAGGFLERCPSIGDVCPSDVLEEARAGFAGANGIFPFAVDVIDAAKAGEDPAAIEIFEDMDKTFGKSMSPYGACTRTISSEMLEILQEGGAGSKSI
eukprot:CAMPEP_0170282432 /NCGR_PEP_ID=MMETSP0116_2-20130129/41239_1 /TAXON_ID=400756 /ORGANISM="Durinskia baltica, Strain CSIRO CS-38" /LENGTH=172 /DNA_ID=CAMNT_0010533781 /DNA_START=71 /DNA_END=586 /DNA_ORIENTATION=-